MNSALFSELRVAYAGTPAFARVALEAILAQGFQVPLVLTQPDRPAGRGMRLQPSEVKQCALGKGIDVLQPAGLRLDGKYAAEAQRAQAQLAAYRPDVLVVAAYGLILPAWVLALPRLGCLNIHASLLPRWRGAAPIQRAIEAGDAQTGVTIMQMDAGLDTGAMLQSAVMPITADDTAATLHDKLATLGGNLIVQVLKQAQNAHLKPMVQPEEGVCYAHKIEKSEGLVKWREPAAVIERRIRAFDPFPGMMTTWRGQTVKIWQSRVARAMPACGQTLQPGEVLTVTAEGIEVMTGDGVLVMTVLQRAGGKRLPVREFLQSMPLAVGDMLV